MCHSCMNSLPIIHSPPWDLACRSPLFFSLSFFFYSFLLFSQYLTLAGGQEDRVVGVGWSFVPIITAFYLFFALFIVFPNSNCLWVVSMFFFSMGACCTLCCIATDELAIAATKFDVVACGETRDAKKHVFFKPCFLCKKKSVFYRKKQFFNVFFFFCFFSITGRFLINYSAIRVYL